MAEDNKNYEALFEYVKILGYQTDFQELLRNVSQTSTKLFKADLALVLMLNPNTRETLKTVFKEGKSINSKEYQDVHVHVGGWIISNRQSFISQHIQKDYRFVKGLFDKVPIKSVMGVPMIIEGTIIGAIILMYRDSSDLINTNSIEFLTIFAAISAPFLRNVQKIRQYFSSLLPESSLLLKYKESGLYGKSAPFVELLLAIEAASKCDVRVLLIGKTGTGKELVARAIHNFSSRANFPFTTVECGAIPQTLIESELFGHKRGSFTGALTDRQGLFLEANGGTLFIDEINNLPYEMQSKFLRVLEEGELRPVGSDKTFKTNVRIIAASSVSLKKLVDKNLFREDLYYRLNVYPILVPELNERQEDIPLLAEHFLHHFVKQQNKNAKDFHEEVIDFLKHRSWNGNIRELENFIERIVTIAPPEALTIIPAFFPSELKQDIKEFRLEVNAIGPPIPLKDRLNKYESNIIKKTLVECNWNQSKVARKLNTSESNIRYKIAQYKIRRDEQV